MTALRAHRLTGVAGIVAGAAGIVLFAYAGTHLDNALHDPTNIVVLVYFLAVASLCFQFVAALFERPYRTTLEQAAMLDELDIAVLVPCYNEDPEALRRCLQSFFDQTRKPNAVSVVDDGSSSSTYDAERDWFIREAETRGIRAYWRRTTNHGKRMAQVIAARVEPNVDIYVTVDSDSILDPDAILEAMKPFANPRIQSVAAVILTTNVGANLLTRMVDLICVTLQLSDRSALSTMGSVMVNCGGCALYRASVLRSNVRTYLTETLHGKPMQFSDDSLLTLFALEKGEAVQQPSAFAFTLMPENVNHHVRQQLRWMRGSFIRSYWRFKYLPINRPAYWLHLAKWLQFIALTVVLVILIATGTIFQPVVLIWSLVVTACIQLTLSARYLSVWRSDQTSGQRWAAYLTAPLAALWATFVLRGLRWWAMATYSNVAWGTRAKVEVVSGSVGDSQPR